MPTAAEYQDAAERYRRIGENLSREAGAVGAWVLGFVGPGLIHTEVDESIDRSQGYLVAACEEMRRLARVCDVRAEVCSEYSRAVWRYRRLTFVEQLIAGYPTRPASWVEL